jgi:hypothetical protein
MKTETKNILTKGLAEGYAGKNTMGKVERAGFDLDSSDYEGLEGKYHDEWAAHQLGGGQEIVETPDGEMATRVYAGGTLDPEKLTELGLTGKDVIKKLLFFVGELGEKTRLDTDTEMTEGDWIYSYRIIEPIKEIPVTAGIEKIKFKGSLVFVHFHINSPVK